MRKLSPLPYLLVALLLLSFTTMMTAQSTKSPLPNSPVSTGVLMSRAVRAGRVHLTGSSLNRVNPNLTCSPAPCTLPNVDASSSPVLANETPVVVNPANPQQILTGANDYNCTNIQGFYASNDGGSTWTRTCLNALAGDFGEGDPGVAYDAAGTAYISGIDATHGIVFEASRNNGTTWSTPQLAVPPFFSGGLTDKPWMQIDTSQTSPFKNTIYMSVTQFDASETNIVPTVSHSSDGGKTWSAPIALDTTQVFPAVDQFTDIATGADGTVYVTWMRCTATGPSGDCGRTLATFYLAKSTDGGNTFSSPTVIATAGLAPDPGFCCFYGQLPNTDERISNIPVIAIDNSSGPNAGNLYVAYYTWKGYMRLLVATSKDGGNTWSVTSPTPASDTHDQFFPWINVSRNGFVGVSWMDRRNDPANVNYEAFAAFSSNGGASFSTNLDMSAAPSDPFNDGFGGAFIGDYTGNAWAGSTLYVTYTDTTTGIDQDFLTGVATQ